ncbi:MAG: hypothetical protein EP330_26260 [Deltaproteobacteria bacterium]|nr:MAG: hypothetical protein EP330_26260 [Deltaproteobacteria bacterium]
MARTFLAFVLVALGISGCYPVVREPNCTVGGYAEIGSECCPDFDQDGVCDPQCSAPFVSDGAGGCECPEGSSDDGIGGCCVDCHSDPVFPRLVALNASWGMDAGSGTVEPFQILNQGSEYIAPPAAGVWLFDSYGSFLCGWYAEVDASTADLPNETSFLYYADDGAGGVLETTFDTLGGFEIPLASANIRDMSEVNSSLVSCGRLLDPAVWGSDPATTLAAGGQTLYVGYEGEVTSDHSLFADISALEDFEQGKTLAIGFGSSTLGYLDGNGWGSAFSVTRDGDGVMVMDEAWEARVAEEYTYVSANPVAVDARSFAIDVDPSDLLLGN